MNIPEFSAGCSLYESSKTYVATPNYAAAGNAVIPALPVFRFCKNARPGWAIEDTLCAECATFAIRCSKTSCWYEQLTPWENECFDATVYGD